MLPATPGPIPDTGIASLPRVEALPEKCGGPARKAAKKDWPPVAAGSSFIVFINDSSLTGGTLDVQMRVTEDEEGRKLRCEYPDCGSTFAYTLKLV